MEPTPRIGVIHDRLRAEERLLFAEFARRGIDVERIDDRQTSVDITNDDWHFDAVIGRGVSQQRTLHLLSILDAWGVPTLNRPDVIAVCNDKLRTSALFRRAGLPQPELRVAFHTGSGTGRRRRDGLSGGAEAGHRLLGPPVG